MAKRLACSCSTVSRTPDRWEQYGEAGLIDRRGDDRQVKADDPRESYASPYYSPAGHKE